MGDIGPNSGVRRNPNDVRKLIVRELEKQRISEEMILEEIARRREVEAVVRQEIVFLERAMAMRRMAMGARSFEDGFPTAMRMAPFAFSPRSAAFDQFPVVKPPSEPDKNKLIVLVSIAWVSQFSFYFLSSFSGTLGSLYFVFFFFS